MRRNLRFVRELIKLRMQQLMVFRLGFFGPFFVDGSMFIIHLMVFGAVYANVDSIGGWTKGEMIVFIGTFSLINAFNMVIYFFGVLTIPYRIKNGEMDFYLTKPVNPLLRLTFENVNPGSIPLIFFSIAIIVYGVVVGNIEITALRVVTYLFLVLIMTLLFYDLEVILRTISFLFIVAGDNIQQIEGAAIELCIKVPGTVFKGFFKVLFYGLIPYGIMATIPTQALCGSLTIGTMLFGTGIVTVFTVFTFSFWKFGVKHYNSASS